MYMYMYIYVYIIYIYIYIWYDRKGAASTESAPAGEEAGAAKGEGEVLLI